MAIKQHTHTKSWQLSDIRITYIHNVHAHIRIHHTHACMPAASRDSANLSPLDPRSSSQRPAGNPLRADLGIWGPSAEPTQQFVARFLRIMGNIIFELVPHPLRKTQTREKTTRDICSTLNICTYIYIEGERCIYTYMCALHSSIVKRDTLKNYDVIYAKCLQADWVR